MQPLETHAVQILFGEMVLHATLATFITNTYIRNKLTSYAPSRPRTLLLEVVSILVGSITHDATTGCDSTRSGPRVMEFKKARPLARSSVRHSDLGRMTTLPSLHWATGGRAGILGWDAQAGGRGQPSWNPMAQ
jgi:hypothetical protein